MGRVSVERRSAFEWINRFWDTHRKRPKVCAWVLIKLFAMRVRVVRFGWLAALYCSTLPAIASSGQPHKPYNRNRDKIYVCAQVVLSYACSAHSKGLFLFVRFCMNFISHNYSLTHGRARLRIFAYVKRYPSRFAGGRETAAHIEAVHLYI